MTASEQTRKKTTWLMLDRVMLRVLEEVYEYTCWWYDLCRDEKCEGYSRRRIWRQREWPRQWRLLGWCGPRRGAEYRLHPCCKIRLGTNGETSRVSTGMFTVTRHTNRSCQYMEDIYCDNDYINVTPTRCSVLITSKSGDELISLREQFIGRAEQYSLQHCYIPVRTTCTTSEVWLVSSTLDSVESRVWTAHTAIPSREWQQYSLLSVSGW